jgi:hypothetical protein
MGNIKMHEAEFRSGQQRLLAKLRGLNISRLPISDYTKRYLSDQLRSDAYVGTFAQVLVTATSSWTKPLGEWRMVDLGGGTGLQSLLALESGVGHVTYSDIYDVAANDAARLAEALGLHIDRVIVGDTELLVAALNGATDDVDAIVSYDVIEHIYDVAGHFHSISGLRYRDLHLTYGSGANSANPRYVRQVRRTQNRVEYQTRPEEWGHKDRDSLRGYVDIRRDIVRRAAPDLPDAAVDDLAKRSRGLMDGDIERLVVNPYLAGRPTYRPSHPSNTCDPITGNWCEQLLDFDWIVSAAANAGLVASIGAGRYSMAGSLKEDLVRQTLNAGIATLGAQGIRLAPFYVVTCERSPSR